MAALQRLAVVVACTDRKSVETQPRMLLRSVPTASVSQRFRRWATRRDTADQTVPAEDLYSGGLWSVARSIPSAVNGSDLEVDLWILSAGYGLIHATDRVAPYGATFTGGQLDSVSRAADAARVRQENREWWSLLAEDRPNVHVSSLTNLAEASEAGHILVAASRQYLDAAHHDLLGACEVAGDKLHILCPPNSKQFPQESSVPVDARVKSVIGGSTMAVVPTMARHLVSTWNSHGFHQKQLREAAQAVLDRGSIEVFDRAPMSDREVRDFVEEYVKLAPRPSKTAALRQLRDSGRACEQRRFGKLYQQATDQSLAVS